MQPNENNETNMSTLGVQNEANTGGLSATDNTASTEQSPNNQPPVEQKKTKKGLIIGLILALVLIVGICVAVVVMMPKGQGQSGDNQGTAEEAEDEEEEEEEEEEEIEVAKPKVEINDDNTAEVKNGTFSINDQSGSTLVEDNQLTNVTGIYSCDYIKGEEQSTINCYVETADGRGVYVYYPEEDVLKFAEQ